MSNMWKLLPLAVIAAFGALMLLFSAPGPGRVDVAEAAITVCGSSGDYLRVNIIDDDTGDEITVTGAEITVDPDPQDGSGARTFADNGTNDDSTTVGRIQQNDACNVTGTDAYDITLDSLPAPYDDCDIEDATLTTELTANTTVAFTLTNCPNVTPTPAATGTVGAARTVVVTSSNQALGCANTTIITITVRGANGQPVTNGTLVNITASIGAVSPTSGQTTADGSVFVFYTAPQNQGGTATITATAGTASGTVNITVTCNTAPTQAPPPTTSAAISPPNTGDGGVAAGSSWRTYAGIALIVASVLATLALVRPRAYTRNLRRDRMEAVLLKKGRLHLAGVTCTADAVLHILN
jgi:hypothetical protein